MGYDFELIATCLELTQHEIDIIKRDNSSTKAVIHKILVKWKKKLGRAATLEMLEKSLRDAEDEAGASVDWGAFYEAKKLILSNRK
jgi:hypothetical protein